ncbi:MAG: hypothetical protein AAB408_01240 [Patescibacteria group bacterium]
MNSLSDILNQKADELFIGDLPPLDSTGDDKQAISIPPLVGGACLPAGSGQGGVSTFLPTSEPVVQVPELKRLIYAMKGELDAMLRVLDGQIIISNAPLTQTNAIAEGTERVLEGVFTGEKMTGDDGKEYAVPPNYASKSKLVTGDRMKLTITKSGSFIFKQIGPAPRKRVIGELTGDPANNQWAVLTNDKHYRILTASVTFYHGKAGDEVILLLPQQGEAGWGTVDNIINK